MPRTLGKLYLYCSSFARNVKAFRCGFSGTSTSREYRCSAATGMKGSQQSKATQCEQNVYPGKTWDCAGKSLCKPRWNEENFGPPLSLRCSERSLHASQQFSSCYEKMLSFTAVSAQSLFTCLPYFQIFKSGFKAVHSISRIMPDPLEAHKLCRVH